MEKVSHIISPSARQVWISGEVEKPRRVADPVPGEMPAIPQRMEMPRPSKAEMAEINTSVLEGSGLKGTKLNTMA